MRGGGVASVNLRSVFRRILDTAAVEAPRCRAVWRAKWRDVGQGRGEGVRVIVLSTGQKNEERSVQDSPLLLPRHELLQLPLECDGVFGHDLPDFGQL